MRKKTFKKTVSYGASGISISDVLSATGATE